MYNLVIKSKLAMVKNIFVEKTVLVGLNYLSAKVKEVGGLKIEVEYFEKILFLR